MKTSPQAIHNLFTDGFDDDTPIIADFDDPDLNKVLGYGIAGGIDTMAFEPKDCAF